MQRRDTRSFLSVLYLLIVLFLAVLYVQGNFLSSPESLATIEAVTNSTTDSNAVILAQSLNFSTENILVIFAAATIFFASAWVLEQSRG